MERREFIVTLGVGLLAAPLAAEAQREEKVYCVAVVFGSRAEDPVSVHTEKAMGDRLADLGYVAGRTLTIEVRGTDGTLERARSIAAELVAMKPHVTVVWSTLHAAAVKEATSTLPVVFLGVALPVEAGLVASLHSPGGNMTGVSFDAALETYGKSAASVKTEAPKPSEPGHQAPSASDKSQSTQAKGEKESPATKDGKLTAQHFAIGDKITAVRRARSRTSTGRPATCSSTTRSRGKPTTFRGVR